jgi:hypothetical protein
MKKLSLLIFVLFCTAFCFGQASFQPPIVSVSNATTGIKWTAGTVNNGGHPVAVAAGTSTVTLNKTDCSSPGFANCNFVFVNSTGTVAVTTTLATAVASGDSIIALIEAGAVTTTQIVYPWQSGTVWLQSAGPLSGGFTNPPTPSVAGATDLGTVALPWGHLFLGTAATNNFQFNPSTTTGSRIFQICDPGTNGAVCFGDQTDATKTFILDSHSATTGKALTIAHALANSRTVTFPDGGGNTSVMYTNNNASTVQAVSSINSFTGNKAILTADFTDANASGLQVITGLSFTLPTSFVGNLAFHCSLIFSQATPGASDQFGVTVLTTAATRIDAEATVSTNTTAVAVGTLANLATTTPTSIITFTQVASAGSPAYIDGVAQLPGGGSQVLQFYVTNGTAANVIKILAGSYCTIN